MKIITLVIASLLYVSCTNTKSLSSKGGVNFYGYDFRNYSSEGFLFTPEKPVGYYTSVGMIQVVLEPEILELDATTFQRDNRNGIYIKGEKKYALRLINYPTGNKFYAVEIIEISDAIDEMYKFAIDWGANAIVNFNVETSLTNFELLVSTITVEGFAIIRDKSD